MKKCGVEKKRDLSTSKHKDKAHPKSNFFLGLKYDLNSVF